MQINGLTGYSDLHTDSSNIQAAVQDFLNPDVEEAKVATAVALGRKVVLKTPTPEQTTITVLNGNGVEGAAANAGYLLSQRGYQIVPPPGRCDGQRAAHRLLPVQGLLEPAREALGGGGEVGGEAVRAGRRRRR